jgi:hypothetical protein
MNPYSNHFVLGTSVFTLCSHIQGFSFKFLYTISVYTSDFISYGNWSNFQVCGEESSISNIRIIIIVTIIIIISVIIIC